MRRLSLFIKETLLFWVILLSILIKECMFISSVCKWSFNIVTHELILNNTRLLVYISFSVVILSFSLLFKHKRQLYMLLLLDLIITIVMIGDLIYYSGFTTFLSLFLLQQTSNLNNLGPSILSLCKPQYLFLIVDILILILFIAKYRNSYVERQRKLKTFFLITILASIYIGYAHYQMDIRKTKEGNLFNLGWNDCSNMVNLGPVGYHVVNTYQFIGNNKKYTLTNKDKSALNKYFSENKEILPSNQYEGIFKGKNLLVIQVESLEGFVIGQKINNQEITPNLNKLLNHSIYFNNFYYNVWEGNSSDADLMTNAGVYPIRKGSTFFRFSNNTYKNSLPKLLAEKGYETTALHPDPGVYWNWLPSLKSIGFKKCYASNSFDSKIAMGVGIPDHEFLPQVAKIIENQPKPFYSFLVTITSHTPFKINKEFQYMKLPNELNGTILGDYFQSIRYTDEAIGKFTDELEKNGVLKDTVVVVYGDHGSIHRSYKDELKNISPKESWWSSADDKIPLIIYNSELKPEVMSVYGSQIDTLPTIAYMMGIPQQKYNKSTFGKVLLNTKRNYTIVNNEMKGNYTSRDKQDTIDAVNLSDIAVRSNYFKDN